MFDNLKNNDNILLDNTNLDKINKKLSSTNKLISTKVIKTNELEKNNKIPPKGGTNIYLDNNIEDYRDDPSTQELNDETPVSTETKKKVSAGRPRKVCKSGKAVRQLPKRKRKRGEIIISSEAGENSGELGLTSTADRLTGVESDDLAGQAVTTTLNGVPGRMNSLTAKILRLMRLGMSCEEAFSIVKPDAPPPSHVTVWKYRKKLEEETLSDPEFVYTARQVILDSMNFEPQIREVDGKTVTILPSYKNALMAASLVLDRKEPAMTRVAPNLNVNAQNVMIGPVDLSKYMTPSTRERLGITDENEKSEDVSPV